MPKRTFSKDVEDLIAEQESIIKSRKIRFLRCILSSLAGTSYCMEENASLYSDICHKGVDVDGSSIPGYTYLSNSDLTLFPEPETLIFGEGDRPYAEVICMAHLPDGSIHPGDPRGILYNTVEKMKRMGFKEAKMSGELEFYLVKKDKFEPYDEAGYCTSPPIDEGMEFRHELLERFEKANISVSRVHHEVSPGQNEIALLASDALHNADSICRGMQITRQLARERGCICTYSPRPFPKFNGSGLHEHMSLVSDKGENAFAGDNEGLSDIALSFIAGLCKYGREITAGFAISDRSFQRLRPNFEAPIWTGWDIANRSALVRVPRINKDSPERVNVEFRAGDASGSPYILSSLILSAGLRGIEENMMPNPRGYGFNFEKLDEKTAEEMKIERLPVSMDEAKKILLSPSDYLKETLGDYALEFLSKYYYVEPKDEAYEPGKYRKSN